MATFQRMPFSHENRHEKRDRTIIITSISVATIFIAIVVIVVIGLVVYYALHHHNDPSPNNGGGSPTPSPSIPGIKYVSENPELILIYVAITIPGSNPKIEPSDTTKNQIIQALGTDSHATFATLTNVSDNFSVLTPSTSPSWCGRTGFVLEEDPQNPRVIVLTPNPNTGLSGCSQGLNILNSSALANGFVMYGKRPVQADEMKAVPQGFRIAPYNTEKWSRFEQ